MNTADWLNYHHLYYFYTIARLGSVTKASQELRLAQPTVSAQLRALETQLEERLFERTGRRMILTEAGHLVFRYAENIFGLGRELREVLRGRPGSSPLVLNVGVSDVVPKLISYRLLAPVLRRPEFVRLVCREDKTERLLDELASQSLDLLITDAPLAGRSTVKAFNHQLGECGVSFFAADRLSEELGPEFPRSLSGAPFLMPAANGSFRRALEGWFMAQRIEPRIVAEFDDSALLKVFGQAGEGVFAGPSAIAPEICRQYHVRELGRTHEVLERFYGISVRRKIDHPAARLLLENARERLFR